MIARVADGLPLAASIQEDEQVSCGLPGTPSPRRGWAALSALGTREAPAASQTPPSSPKRSCTLWLRRDDLLEEICSEGGFGLHVSLETSQQDALEKGWVPPMGIPPPLPGLCNSWGTWLKSRTCTFRLLLRLTDRPWVQPAPEAVSSSAWSLPYSPVSFWKWVRSCCHIGAPVWSSVQHLPSRLCPSPTSFCKFLRLEEWPLCDLPVGLYAFILLFFFAFS